LFYDTIILQTKQAM